MSGNLGETYESFLARCIGGFHKEQEAFQELAEITKHLDDLEKRGNALGLQEGWEFEGAEELTESYRKGKEAMEKEGDVYAVLPLLRNLARHCDEVLNTWVQEQRRQREQEAEEQRRKHEQKAEEARRNRAQQDELRLLSTDLAVKIAKAEEAEKAVREAEKAVGDAEESKKKAEAKVKEAKKLEGGLGGLCLLTLGLCLLILALRGVDWLICLPLAMGIIFHMMKKGRKRKMEGMLNRLEAAEKKAAVRKEEKERIAAMLRQRKGEVERTSAMLKQRQKEAGSAEAIGWVDNLLTMVSNLVAEMVPIPGKNFMMGKHEVTQAQWKMIMGKNPSNFQGADYPVECVSWNDCQDFLKKLNALPDVKKTGLVFRLPTEEEWEFACRAGATGNYCRLADGTEITENTLAQVAWFDDNSGGGTYPVGQKKPNAFGLYDMHGNVWEWTSTADGGNRVLRGGSWHYKALYCTASSRLTYYPWNASCHNGFRLASSLLK